MAKRVLIMSGGGSKGAFQAGVIEQLNRAGWDPDAVAGISVGALNGVMVATGQSDKLIRIWQDLREEQVLKKRRIDRQAKNYLLHKIGVEKATLGFFDNSPLKKKLKESVGSKFTKHYYCGTVNIETGAYKEHIARPMMVPWNYLDAVIASTAIPVVFDPVNLDGELHVDGGVRHMNPIGKILQEHNPDEIIFITTRKFDEPNEVKKVDDVVDVAIQSLNILLEEIFMKDLREFIRINELVRQADEQGAVLKKSNGEPFKVYKATLYQPDKSLGDSLNFSNEQANRNINIGLEAEPIDL
ncbi:MAG TPA: patatin-like phospholipase family protein [Balneolaceae bacterium]|nr:patatin-like phospholipase family protein [Balneolaceae bacterium]